MPRFENEGYNSNNKSKNIDRTVPDDENYYGNIPVDLDFNNRTSLDRDNIVRDNQRRNVPQGNSNDEMKFHSESYEDFDTGRRDNRPSKNGRDNKNNNGSNKKKVNISAAKKVLAVVLAIIIIFVGAMMPVLGRMNYDDKKENEYVDSSDLKSSPMVKNILLLGVDARSSEDSSSSRSDTMMLVSVDMKHHCIKMTSFLRDTWVYIPSLGHEQRLNAACSDGGYQNVADTIEYNFGVDIDGYVVVDFEMFKVLVDSLGGVEIDVTEKEAREVTNHPKRYGNVTLEAGKNTLTGEQALAYCRIRKIDTDFERTHRQREVMSAILNSAKRSNPFKLYKMAFNSAPYLETSLGKMSLMNFVMQAGFCITGDLHQQKVPFDGTWDYATIQGNSVISINEEENKEKLIDYIYNKSSADIKAEED